MILASQISYRLRLIFQCLFRYCGGLSPERAEQLAYMLIAEIANLPQPDVSIRDRYMLKRRLDEIYAMLEPEILIGMREVYKEIIYASGQGGKRTDEEGNVQGKGRADSVRPRAESEEEEASEN